MKSTHTHTHTHSVSAHNFYSVYFKINGIWKRKWLVKSLVRTSKGVRVKVLNFPVGCLGCFRVQLGPFLSLALERVILTCHLLFPLFQDCIIRYGLWTYNIWTCWRNQRLLCLCSPECLKLIVKIVKEDSKFWLLQTNLTYAEDSTGLIRAWTCLV